MQAKKYLYWLALAGFAVMALALLSALITATGAFSADAGKRVNRIDFVWAVAGLVIAASSYYRARKLNSKP